MLGPFWNHFGHNLVAKLKKNVISVSGLAGEGDMSPEQINAFFAKEDGDRIEAEYIELKSGKTMEKSAEEMEAMIKADLKKCNKPKLNKPKIKCLPTYEKIFNVYKGTQFDRVGGAAAIAAAIRGANLCGPFSSGGDGW